MTTEYLQLLENEKNLKHNLQIERNKLNGLEKKYKILKENYSKLEKNIKDSDPSPILKKNPAKPILNFVPKLTIYNVEVERIRKSIKKLSKKGKYLNMDLDDIPKAEPPIQKNKNQDIINTKKYEENSEISKNYIYSDPVIEERKDKYETKTNIQEIKAENFDLFDPFLNCNSDSEEDSDYD